VDGCKGEKRTNDMEWILNWVEERVHMGFADRNNVMSRGSRAGLWLSSDANLL